MHSSVALAQFFGTLVMTALRGWVRRGLSEAANVEKVRTEKDYEKDDLAMHIGKCRDWKVKAGVDGLEIEVGVDCLANRVMRLRKDIGNTAKWGDMCDVACVSGVTNEALNVSFRNVPVQTLTPTRRTLLPPMHPAKKSFPRNHCLR
jgi:hypothetical protein